jgi:hypothetical protein
MNCLHCQKELPADNQSPWCPFCGRDLALTPKPGKDDQTLAARSRPMFRWKLFLCAFLGPVLLTMVSAAVVHFTAVWDRNEPVTPWIALISGTVGGIVCGILLGCQSRNPAVRAVLVLLMSCIMIVVCIVLCFFGCTFGGYDLRIGG